jgi:hypothetical protein
MRLTHHIVVEYDDETKLSEVHVKLCSSFLGCAMHDSRGALVAGGLARDDLRTVLGSCVRSVLRDHVEVDGLPRFTR